MLEEKDPEIAEVELKYAQARKGDVRDSLADIAKARRMLNYNPKISVLAGVERAIDWYWNDLK